MAMNLGSWASRSVATKVVATDGTGDFTDIQEAIDALPAAGGCVYIKEGIYTPAAKIHITLSNVKINGCGKATKIQPTHNNYVFHLEGILSAVTIRDLWIYGNGTGLLNFGIAFGAATECQVEGCWIENCGSAGIVFGTSADRCMIYGNFIYSNMIEGIWLFHGGESVIANNIIYGNKTHGISVSQSDNNVIRGNICKDNDVDNTGTYDGINISGESDNNVVMGNRCLGNDNYGIEVFNVNCNKNLLLGNVLLGNTTGGINNNGTNTEIAHNIIT